MEPRDWIDRFAARLDVDAPEQATIDVILELAGAAARSSERISAPVTCWLAGRAGISVTDALRMAEELSEDA